MGDVPLAVGTLRYVAVRCGTLRRKKTTQHAVLHRVQCERSLKGRSHVRCALLRGAGKTLLVFLPAQRSSAHRMYE